MVEILKKYKNRIFQLLIIVLIILGVRWYVGRDSSKSISVRDIEIEERVVERTISATGEVMSKKEASLSFNTIGRISEISVKKGDFVEEGQFLASIDASALSQSVQALKDARDITLREKELFIETYSSKMDDYGGEDEYNIRLRQLEEAISQAEATYMAKAITVGDTYIYAPFKGIVVDKMKEEGETVLAGTTVLKIADMDDVVFEITLDQEDYGLVQKMMPATIELDAYEDKEFSGTILELPYYANGEGTSNFSIEISISGTDGKQPLIGMTGDAHIIIQKTGSSVNSLVYDEIFLDEEDNSFVWIEENGKLFKEFIETGLEGDIYTELLSRPEKNVVVPVDDTLEVKEGYNAKFAR
jgi:RND family efflux transporter MFP subunit